MILRLPIETQRLCIAKFDESMAAQLHLNSLDEDNRRFVPDEVFETIEVAREKIEWFIDSYSRENAPLVYAVLLYDKRQIGYVQACPYKKGWEIGYHIAKNYTGNGYATEALRAFLHPVMKQLGIPMIYGICLADNIASRRVLEKCGFTQEFDGTGEYQGKMRHICRYQYTIS